MHLLKSNTCIAPAQARWGNPSCANKAQCAQQVVHLHLHPKQPRSQVSRQPRAELISLLQRFTPHANVSAEDAEVAELLLSFSCGRPTSRPSCWASNTELPRSPPSPAQHPPEALRQLQSTAASLPRVQARPWQPQTAAGLPPQPAALPMAPPMQQPVPTVASLPCMGAQHPPAVGVQPDGNFRGCAAVFPLGFAKGTTVLGYGGGGGGGKPAGGAVSSAVEGCGGSGSGGRGACSEQAPGTSASALAPFVCMFCKGPAALRGEKRPTFFCSTCPTPSGARKRAQRAWLGDRIVGAAEAVLLVRSGRAANAPLQVCRVPQAPCRSSNPWACS